MSKTKKTLSIVLALVLVLSLSISAFAASPADAGTPVAGTAHVTLSSDATGAHTYTAVKIADLYEMGQNGNDKVYQYVHILAAQLQGEPTFVQTLIANGFQYDANTGAITVGGNNIADNSDSANKLAAAIEHLVAGKSGLTTENLGLGAPGADLSYGYWVIFENANGGNDGTVATKPILVDVRPEDGEQIAITLKDAKVDLDKTVNEKQEDSVSIGDTVNYKIATNFPVYEYTQVNGVIYAPVFTVSDKLSAGLDFANAENPTVKVGTDTAAKGTDYTVAVSNDGKTMTITFTPAYILAHQGERIEITYSAVVNSNAAVNNTNGNPNDVTLTYSNQPEEHSDVKTLEDKTPVYTYAFDLKKLDGANDALLPGATFEMKKGDDVMFFIFDETTNTYTYVSTATAPDAAKNITSVITTTDADIVFKGLDEGTYTLTEKEAPTGYSKLANPIQVTITDEDSNEDLDGVATISVQNATVKATDAVAKADEGTSAATGDENVNVVVRNYKGVSLPETGSLTSIIVMVAGALIVLGGAYLVLSRKKVETK